MSFGAWVVYIMIGGAFALHAEIACNIKEKGIGIPTQFAIMALWPAIGTGMVLQHLDPLKLPEPKKGLCK